MLAISSGYTLGNLGDKRAIPIFCKAVENDESSNVRANALIALVNFDTPEVRACIKSAFDDPDESVSKASHEMYEKFKWNDFTADELVL